MKFRSIKYFFSEAFGGVIRNRLMSIASIGTVAACIFMIAISYCALTNVNYKQSNYVFCYIFYWNVKN